MLSGGLFDGVPHTFCCAGTIEKSCWTCRPTQIFFFADDALSQTLSALHFSPPSQSELVSHVPALHASPSPHSRSFSQLAPQPLVPPFLLHPGKPGGQSALSLHFVGG